MHTILRGRGWRVARTSLLCILCLSVVAAGAINAQAHSLFPEGGMDCSDNALELPPEWTQALEGPTRRLVALAHRGKTEPVTPSMSALAVTLYRADAVQALVESQSGGNSSGSYAGLIGLSVPQDGVYRISSVSPLGIKVVTSKGRVESHAFEFRSRCDKTFKSVDFKLQAGLVYWLELSSKSQEVLVMITPE